MTIDQIEEHGLVLAIQAAHHASRLQQGNISSYSSSSGLNFNSSMDSDREEAGLPAQNTFSSNQLGTPRERKAGQKLLSRSRSLPYEREDTGDTALDIEDGYVHVEEKPSAELFLVGSLLSSLCSLTRRCLVISSPWDAYDELFAPWHSHCCPPNMDDDAVSRRGAWVQC